MGNISLLDLEKSVLNLLNETYDSTVGDLPTGGGGDPAIKTITEEGESAESTVKTLLNEAAVELARTCYPIPETGTIAWAANARTNLLKDFIPASATTTSGASAKTITGATNATPIVITATAHGFANGDFVTVASVGGNTAANGSWTVASVTANTFALAGSSGSGDYTSGGSATEINGNPLWAARGVKFGSTALAWADRAAVDRSNPSWMSASAGTPTHWYAEGQGIGLYVVPSASYTTVTVSGLAEPKPLVADTDTLPWLPDSLSHLLAWYAASRLAMKNAEDATLVSRAADWQALYDRGRNGLWLKIEPSLRKAHYPHPPAG